MDKLYENIMNGCIDIIYQSRLLFKFSVSLYYDIGPILMDIHCDCSKLKKNIMSSVNSSRNKLYRSLDMFSWFIDTKLDYKNSS